MATISEPHAIGSARTRVEAREKVTGTARYAIEHQAENVAYGWIVQARVARGRIKKVRTKDALAIPGVLAVLSHENAPKLVSVSDPELSVLQSPRIAYRGQIVAAVVADSAQAAREAAEQIVIEVSEEDHDVELRGDHPGLYAPEKVNAGYPTTSVIGDVEAGLRLAAAKIDQTYSTPPLHNNPMEPHASLALWNADGTLTIYDSNQGAPAHAAAVAAAFGLQPPQVHVLSHHVGGGFGSKGTPRPQIILAAMLAKAVDRPVKLPVTRQQMFAFTGYRTPTIQHIRLGVDEEGRLTAISQEVASQTSQIREFVEQTAVPARWMYASPNRRTHHEVVALDVPTPSWMRAPGECPGMYGLESAMDELAYAAGIDPVVLRIRNEPAVHPEEDKPWSSRNLVACLREGAARFGWQDRPMAPRSQLDGRWLVGSGVASATYPAYQSPSRATARALPDGTFVVRVGAADIGTGARTVLGSIAADALGVDPARVVVEIGESLQPRGPVAGGSMGTASWGTAVTLACQALLEELRGRGIEAPGAAPSEPIEVAADSKTFLDRRADLARHAFGAHFAEVRVNIDTGEIRLSRMLGVFAAGRIINPTTARSQFIGGMTMGMSMALLEESVVDLEFGDFLNHDLAQYHVAACADVPEIEATWLDEQDDDLNPMGSKGIGEIGIVGSAAAVANAVFHATGIRIRDLPVLPDKLLPHL
ncbi:MAG TPA: xanthine dehydrogenase family protein molybdopterin-binding subunit [Solirubrobacteraceae bacterium]|nr:xanthine dehydrogenase family protein molybdopterin-binding subunit [Solirubrobacteraceae bacterium]